MRLLGVTAVYLALTVVATYPQVRQLASGIRDDIDVYFSVWRLAWIAHQLPGHPFQLFDANIFYPERHTLAYSDALVGPGVVAGSRVAARACSATSSRTAGMTSSRNHSR